VLDVACGPGTVARLAAVRVGPSGQVTACDLSPAMLAVAEAKASLADAAPITYRQCPADELAVADQAFDVALCQQGLQFFPDRVAALSEMRRALQPGGRAGVSVWCAIEECPFWDALASAVGSMLGRRRAGLSRRPVGPLRPGRARPAVRRRRFHGCAHRPSHPTGGVRRGPAQLVATLPAASVGPQVAALDDQGRASLLAAAEEALGPFLDNGRVHSEAASHVIRATR